MRVRGVFAPTTTRFLRPLGANDMQNVENQACLHEQDSGQKSIAKKPNPSIPADSIVAPQDAYIAESKISYRSFQNLVSGSSR